MATAGLFFATAQPRNGPESLLFPYVTARARRTHPQLKGYAAMRMSGIGLIAAAMLAGSMGIAVAQTSTTTTSPSAASPAAGKCWDSVTKQVRNETPSTGSSTSGSMSGTSSSSTGTGSTSTSSTAKPPEAAGLPDCKR